MAAMRKRNLHPAFVEDARRRAAIGVAPKYMHAHARRARGLSQPAWEKMAYDYDRRRRAEERPKPPKEIEGTVN